ncbi:M14 family metallopeptidase [Lentibacillus sp. N15]|uniref:M14 family metallopeptidase n=1 Tax=Lentibacillus songyuanensis TaxID=3136161 RepID=UPI0031BA6377
MEVIVRRNDSLWYFSQLFDIPTLLIEKSNPKLTASSLSAGQCLQIPGYRLREYIACENDSLWEIAKQHHLAMDALLLVNPFIKYYTIQAGQQLNIPERIHHLVVPDGESYTYEKLVDSIEQLITIYPFIQAQSIGQSVMGKDLMELTIGMGDKHVHINGSFHANEWITTSVILKFLNHYVLALTNNTSLNGIFMLSQYMNTCLSIVPMVNPDGVNLVLNGAAAAGPYQEKVYRLNHKRNDFSGWKANISGVDLNKQYPALWEKEAERKPVLPGPRDFPGQTALSEPESIAMAELAKRKNFSQVMAFHTQGKEIYWGFAGLEPAFAACIVDEYARVSGYQAVRHLDNYAGYKDWFIKTFHKPGFTIELGSGVNPLPIEQFSIIYRESLGIMLALLYLPDK